MKLPEDELFTIFDEQMNAVGTATRSEVHKKGYWHETFQCWLVKHEVDATYIYLQIRSHNKKDYPSLYDITAAGHLLAHEQAEDGVREMQEEIGIDVPFGQLQSLGIMKYAIDRPGMLDREFAHVYMYQTNHSFDEFVLQTEEVAGMAKIKLQDFYELWLGQRSAVEAEGFMLTNEGQKEFFQRNVQKEHFVPHDVQYFLDVIEGIQRLLCD